MVGSAHPHKAGAAALLETAVAARERLVADAEVLQEILHRYVAIDRRDAIQPAFDALLGVVDDVFPVDRDGVDRAKAIGLGSKRLSARAALHLAIMEINGVDRIMSFDEGFDGVPGVVRVGHART